MKLTSKGRYAVMAMADLAKNKKTMLKSQSALQKFHCDKEYPYLF